MLAGVLQGIKRYDSVGFVARGSRVIQRVVEPTTGRRVPVGTSLELLVRTEEGVLRADLSIYLPSYYAWRDRRPRSPDSALYEFVSEHAWRVTPLTLPLGWHVDTDTAHETGFEVLHVTFTDEVQAAYQALRDEALERGLIK